MWHSRYTCNWDAEGEEKYEAENIFEEIKDKDF